MDTGRAIVGAALILSVTIALSVAASHYFSPYQICKREVKSQADSIYFRNLPDYSKIKISNEICIGSSSGYLT